MSEEGVYREFSARRIQYERHHVMTSSSTGATHGANAGAVEDYFDLKLTANLMRTTSESQLLRVVIVEDGAIKSTFACGTTLVLDASCRAMTVHQPATSQTRVTRQLTAFATSAWVRKLLKTLDVRNSLVDTPHYAPCVIKSRGEDGARAFVSAFKVNRVRWSDTDVDLEADGGFSLTSTCGCAKIRLAPHGCFVDVLYPASVGEIGASYEYVWQQQRFASTNIPHRWHFPSCILKSARAFTTGESNEAWCPNEDEELSCTSLPVPTLGGESFDESLNTPWSAQRDDVDSWWANPGLATFDEDFKPSIEWTPHAILWANNGHIELAGVISRCIAVAHESESAIVAPHDSTDFITVIPVGLTQRTIHLDDVPSDPMASKILRIMECLRRFERAVGHGRSRMSDVGEANDASDGFSATSTEILHRTSVAGKGELCAYADGRVRGVFEDRTILLFDQNRENARLVLNDGTRVTVRVRSPATGQWYVQTALAFAHSVWRARESTNTEQYAGIDVSATIRRNDEWLKWCEKNRGLPMRENRSFGDTIRRHDIVADELTKTAAWLASIATQD
jgi:hypothetical protein